MFRFTPSNKISEGELIYVPEDFSLDTINRNISGVASVLINDVQIEIGADHLMIAVWGICPHTTWRQGDVSVPMSQRGSLWFEGDLTPGISIRVTQPGAYWPVTFDSSSGWLHIGQEIIAHDQAIEFVEGCIALLREREMVGLYLRPDYQK